MNWVEAIKGKAEISSPFEYAARLTEVMLLGIASLRAGGTFTTFQYIHAYGFPSAAAVRQTLTREMGSMPTSSLVLGNLPPALVLRWRKQR